MDKVAQQHVKSDSFLWKTRFLATLKLLRPKCSKPTFKLLLAYFNCFGEWGSQASRSQTLYLFHAYTGVEGGNSTFSCAVQKYPKNHRVYASFFGANLRKHLPASLCTAHTNGVMQPHAS